MGWKRPAVIASIRKESVRMQLYPSGFLKAEAHHREGEILDKHYWDNGGFKLEVATAE